jgi:hypothetical protein
MVAAFYEAYQMHKSGMLYLVPVEGIKLKEGFFETCSNIVNVIYFVGYVEKFV